MLSETYITRQALGHVHSIGDYYDALRDNFLHGSFLSVAPSSDVISTQSLRITNYEHGFSDTLQEKTRKFHVDLNLTASLLAGLVKPEGSGKFLVDERESDQIVQASVIYRNSIRRETLNLNAQTLRQNITFDSQPREATHVILGIVSGYCVCANFERQVAKNENKSDVEAEIRAVMGEARLVSSASGHVSAAVNRSTNTTANSFQIKLHADLILERELPQNVEQAMTFFRQLPEYIHGMPATPIEYILSPIDSIKRRFDIAAVDTPTITDVTEITVLRIQEYAETLSGLRRQYNEYYENYRRVSACISRSARQSIDNKRHRLISAEFAYRQLLATLLLQVRANTISEGEFSRRISFDELSRTYEESYSLKEKINFLILALDRHCQLVDESMTPTLISCQYGQNTRHLFLLYINDELILNSREAWRVYTQKFFDKINRFGREALYFIIDYDVHPQSISTPSLSFLLQHYRGANLVEEDDVFNGDSTEKMYCCMCGAEDDGERFILSNTTELGEATPKVSEYGRLLTCSQFRLRDTYTRLPYSSGSHEIRFRVEDFDAPLRFEVSLHHSLETTPEVTSTVIRIGYGAPLSSSASNTCQKNDVYQLMINCAERKVELTNTRTNWTQMITVNIHTHPFPWKCVFNQQDKFFRRSSVVIRMTQVTHRTGHLDFTNRSN